ncbi:Acylphosphatase-1 [Orchesella cincta]|uniref:acylphosphatase n=1 Tax=Orchesella cincta TaxID=48709 RepID=A0A1D2MQZ3_ORCCI|nr:Acylphosphatase-1 [Orchesella cincta]
MSAPLRKAATTSKPAASSTIKKVPSRAASSNDSSILKVNFEIRGKVQGVHFRKYTQMKATSLGLRGWCQNTEFNTVIGCMEGPRLKIEQMKQWLRSTGSPKSIISSADFKDTNPEKYTLATGFIIVK